jgi:hypothetical protein
MFLQKYHFLRAEGWYEVEPFLMAHEKYDSAYSVEEAYNLTKDIGDQYVQ